MLNISNFRDSWGDWINVKHWVANHYDENRLMNKCDKLWDSLRSSESELSEPDKHIFRTICMTKNLAKIIKTQFFFKRLRYKFLESS